MGRVTAGNVNPGKTANRYRRYFLNGPKIRRGDGVAIKIRLFELEKITTRDAYGNFPSLSFFFYNCKRFTICEKHSFDDKIIRVIIIFTISLNLLSQRHGWKIHSARVKRTKCNVVTSEGIVETRLGQRICRLHMQPVALSGGCIKANSFGMRDDTREPFRERRRESRRSSARDLEISKGLGGRDPNLSKLFSFPLSFFPFPFRASLLYFVEKYHRRENEDFEFGICYISSKESFFFVNFP